MCDVCRLRTMMACVETVDAWEHGQIDTVKVVETMAILSPVMDHSFGLFVKDLTNGAENMVPVEVAVVTVIILLLSTNPPQSFAEPMREALSVVCGVESGHDQRSMAN